jgi:hypothetical protein
MSDTERPMKAQASSAAVDLDDAQLEDVSGAVPAVQTPAATTTATTTSDIHFTKTVDVSSPKLF